MQLNYEKTGQTTPDGEQVALSSNGHYAIYTVPRKERDYPDDLVHRYEIVNLSTLAMEARVSHLALSVRLMEEFDSNMEELVNGEYTHQQESIPFEVDSKASH